MAFISADGSIKQKKPFGVQTIVAFLLGIVAFIIYFFRTLFGLTPENGTSTRGGSIPTQRSNNSGGNGWFTGGGAGGSGSGASGRPSGGGSGVGRNVNTMSSMGVNTNFNSCPGGMCGGGPPI